MQYHWVSEESPESWVQGVPVNWLPLRSLRDNKLLHLALSLQTYSKIKFDRAQSELGNNPFKPVDATILLCNKSEKIWILKRVNYRFCKLIAAPTSGSVPFNVDTFQALLMKVIIVSMQRENFMLNIFTTWSRRLNWRGKQELVPEFGFRWYQRTTTIADLL
jgi:hypothetical protein